MYKCVHFGIKELVSPIVYNRFGESAWMFFDEGYLKELDLIREKRKSSIIINNWYTGGSLSQCGLRTNADQIVKDKKGSLYVSGHVLAKGFDLHDGLGQNQKLWTMVYDMIARKELKYFKRLENIKSTPTWVHVDGLSTDNIVFVP